MQRFVGQCNSLGLPLNAGKAVMHAFHSTILGGEFSGIDGTLKHSLDKGQAFISRVATVVAANAVTQVMLQNVAGHFCFMASFRRPLFAILQEVFGEIQLFSDDPKQCLLLNPSSADELIVAALLAPLAGTNLRAPLRIGVSISDASEQGAGAAVATNFVKELSPMHVAWEDLALESATLNSGEPDCAAGAFCSFCESELGPRVFPCHRKCKFTACSVGCWNRHEKDKCTYRSRWQGVCWVAGGELAQQFACEFALAKFFPMVSREAADFKAKLDDAVFCHSVDFLVAAILSRAWAEAKFMILFADFAYKMAVEGKSFLLIFRGRLLKHPAFQKLLALVTVSVVDIRLSSGHREGSSGFIVSNLAKLNLSAVEAGASFSLKVWPESAVKSILSAFVSESGDLLSKALPAGEERQWLWIKKAMSSSTKGLARPNVVDAATDAVFNVLNSAREVSVAEHLRELYQLVDHRGSDVRLDAGEILDSAAQAVPYPAPIWQWSTVLGCKSSVALVWSVPF